jgi:ribulose-5-phosphate 4-epimerase/fuculose-1-phosphate aldolase
VSEDFPLNRYFDDALWITRSLFERGKTAGSTANISFRYKDHLYISGTGTCFGTISKAQFSELDMDGHHLGGTDPSKEYPLHLLMYKNDPGAGAVIHTHSFYATLWSCYCGHDGEKAIPKYTPYLEMKLGAIGWVPYAPPGTKKLFDAFLKVLDHRKGYLLRNHGPVVSGEDLFSAFYALEELEESARIAWELRREEATTI